MAKDNRTILDGRGALRYGGRAYRPGMEDELQAALTPSELARLQNRELLSGSGWEAGREEPATETQGSAEPPADPVRRGRPRKG